jgi:NH3-dependent NAD+ synthetase
MSVINSKNLKKFISLWIANYLKENGKEAIVTSWEPRCDSNVNLELCVKSREFYNTKVIVITNNSSLIKSKYKGLVETYQEGDSEKETQNILANIADKKNGIIAGSLTKTDSLNRSYHKFGKGAADIFPIYDLFYSETKELSKESFEDPIWNFKLEDLEWSVKMNEKKKIITDKETPNRKSDWCYLNLHQKTIVAQIHQREKKTRHKSLNNKPYCLVRSTNFVI